MKTVLLRFGAVLPFASISPAAFAEIDKGGVLNEVSDRFLTESSNWATTITDHASWLFWTLVVISMVWTFGMMALRKADIGEFFAEFTRFTITTGFFWWLLINGPGFAMDIINSLRNIAAEASGLPRGLNPSTPIDIAFDIIAKAASSYSITSPMDNLSIFLTTLAILACMAIVAANVLLALVTAWIIAYAGIFVLGFGGSRWTSDIAVNYFRSVAGIALKIMTMTLLVGIAVSIIDGYHSDLSEGAPMDELLVIFVVSLVMVILVNSVPNVVAGLIPGGGAAASAGSSFSAGALIGGAVGAGAAVASGGAALGSAAISGATNMAGGASAVKAAFQKAQSSMAGGDMPSFGGSSSDTGESWGGSTTGSDNASTGDTPFAQAAGFSGTGSSSSGGGFGRAASLAAGTAGELAKGVGAKMAGSFQDKANQTAGGRLASSIRESMEPKSDTDAGSADQVSDTASFDSDSLSGGNGGGWVNQTGGFDALSSEDQDKARQSHAEWQARDPEKHTFDVGDYVSYAQERQQERNEEVASFVNRDRQDT
ncbi:P-type conjugative transfer protein TrbL [Halomonas llamarensis]|uniref:P-type conjugative transfer protein TrbL n=2 Tax=Gammaproteobacteria TaxID=1236 RepID=A0ABT0SW56_9GAMM|nr:P-type conjugative transfer protein TrbL [Halomonas llamarensis]MCL7931685.1 P-type conjugative transfer protein TrbL [Halomonas llamarensis]